MPNTAYHTTRYGNGTWVPKGMKTKVLESVQRKAEVGEKIVIVKKHYASDLLLDSIFTVTKTDADGVFVKEDDQGIYHWEYEVITKSEEVYE